MEHTRTCNIASDFNIHTAPLFACTYTRTVRKCVWLLAAVFSEQRPSAIRAERLFRTPLCESKSSNFLIVRFEHRKCRTHRRVRGFHKKFYNSSAKIALIYYCDKILNKITIMLLLLRLCLRIRIKVMRVCFILRFSMSGFVRNFETMMIRDGDKVAGAPREIFRKLVSPIWSVDTIDGLVAPRIS